MTDLEIKRQKADLLLEYQEAEEVIARLKEKARHRAESFARVAQWLTRAVNDNLTFDPHNSMTAPGASFKILEDPRYGMSMNFDEIAKLAQEIKDSTDQLRRLGERKRDLGLR